MKKSIKSLASKILILITVPFGVSFILMSKFPLRFYDGEYPHYMQNKDYIENHDEYCRVLIIGDSTGKADWLPTLLSSDTYNLSLGGASTMEEYYYLKEYLEKNDAPEYVIYTIGCSHLIDIDTFWSRSVYFHRINADELDFIMEKSCNFSDGRELLQYDLYTQGVKYQYYMYSPTKYGQALISGIFSNKRYNQYIEKYNKLVANAEQINFGTADYCDDLSSISNLDEFKLSEMLDYYLQETIKLCEDNNIQFIFQNPPINWATFNVLSEAFVSEYESYLLYLQILYPNTIFDEKMFYYGNEFFGDAYHLNIKGTEKFTLEMKKKYSYIFTEE